MITAEQQIRAALERHWSASDVGDFETEHRIYHQDAVLDYPSQEQATLLRTCRS